MHTDIENYIRILKSCNTHPNIHRITQLHLHLLKAALLHSSLYISNTLLQTYTRCNHINDAHKLFDEMPQKNTFTWNSLIEAYLKSGNKQISLQLFNSMPNRNEYTWNTLITTFAKLGGENNLRDARLLFDEMPVRNGTVWNAMIHGYACNGEYFKALELYTDLNMSRCELSKTDTFVLASVVRVCASVNGLYCGRQIHSWVIVNKVDSDSVLLSSFVNMYTKCGDLDSATHVLNSLEKPDNFSLSALVSGYAKCGRLVEARRLFDNSNPCVGLWNSMIAGYVASNQVVEALDLFNKMQKDGVRADVSSFSSILSGCANLGDFTKGKQAHCYAYRLGFTEELIVGSAIIDMYAKCGSPDDACKIFGELQENDTVLLNSMIKLYFSYGRNEEARYVFETMPHRSIISWNSMIVGYSQNGCPIDALNLFCEMHRLDQRTDEVSLASAISSCASITSLRVGEQIFTRIIVVGLEFDQIIVTSLIDLYCKCGSIDYGRRLFNGMIKSDEIPWNSMLMGYSTNGYGTEALMVFDEMRASGVRPNDITFTAVLSACNHSGLVDEGQRWFKSMKSEYNIEPGIEHYSCMIDLFARAGYLDTAMDLIERMPFEAEASMWSSILRGSRAHGDANLGRYVAERIIKLDPESSATYVQLASIHATGGSWEESAEVRKNMRVNGVQKNPGCSWVEMDEQKLIGT